MIVANIKQFENMTLKEINLLHNKQLTKQYNFELLKFGIDKHAKEIIQTLYGAPITEIAEAIEESILEYKSESLFPGSLIKVFPGITEAKAKKEYTCDFSGARINIGNLYVNYRPMLKNIANGEAYVLKKTMKLEPCYEYLLPTNIVELEELINKIDNYQYYEDEDIQYDHLYMKTGGGLAFKKLSRRKNENRNN